MRRKIEKIYFWFFARKIKFDFLAFRINVVLDLSQFKFEYHMIEIVNVNLNRTTFMGLKVEENNYEIT